MLNKISKDIIKWMKIQVRGKDGKTKDVTPDFYNDNFQSMVEKEMMRVRQQQAYMLGSRAHRKFERLLQQQQPDPQDVWAIRIAPKELEWRQNNKVKRAQDMLGQIGVQKKVDRFIILEHSYRLRR